MWPKSPQYCGLARLPRPSASCRALGAAERGCGSGDCRWQSHLASARQAGARPQALPEGSELGRGPAPGEPPEPPTRSHGEQLSSAGCYTPAAL